MDTVSTVHKMTVTVLWLSVSALCSLPKLQGEYFLLLCPFLPSTYGTSLELLPVLIPQNCPHGNEILHSGKQRAFSWGEILPLPACEAWKAPSTEGLAFSQFAAAGCSVLYCWTPRDTTPDMTTLFVKRLSSLELFSKATRESLTRELCCSCRQLLGRQEWQEALPQKVENSICLSFSIPWSIMPDSCFSHTLFAGCTSAFWKSRVSRLGFHVMFAYSSYHLRYYFSFLSWMCLVHEVFWPLSSSPLLPSFLGSCNFYIFFP